MYSLCVNPTTCSKVHLRGQGVRPLRYKQSSPSFDCYEGIRVQYVGAPLA
jgi:hypothetical protein